MGYNTYHRSDNACAYGTIAWRSGGGSSGSGLIKTGLGYLRSYAVSWVGGKGEITLYDALTNTAGTEIINGFANGSTTTVVDFGVDIPFTTGLYAAATGSVRAIFFYY